MTTQPQIEITQRPRGQRTPKSEAWLIFAKMSEFLAETLPEWPDDAFRNVILKPAMEAEYPAGDSLRQDLRTTEWELAEEGYMLWLGAVLLSACYATDALRSDSNGENDLAWSYVVDSKYWLALAIGQVGHSSGDKPADAVVENSRKAAQARHREHYELRMDIVRWCEENFDQFGGNVTKAAEAAAKVVPLKFRTLHTWITAWRRMQSTD